MVHTPTTPCKRPVLLSTVKWWQHVSWQHTDADSVGLAHVGLPGSTCQRSTTGVDIPKSASQNMELSDEEHDRTPSDVDVSRINQLPEVDLTKWGLSKSRVASQPMPFDAGQCCFPVKALSSMRASHGM